MYLFLYYSEYPDLFKLTLDLHVNSKIGQALKLITVTSWLNDTVPVTGMSSIRRSGLLLEAASRTQHLHWVHRKHLKLSAPETYVTRPLVAQDKPLALP